ncbi:MAG: hypothetical protein WA294_03450 [Acidobacteriaceae bacterium]
MALAALAGCNRKQQHPAPPPQSLAPSVPPSEMANQAPKMPPVPPASQPKPVMLDTSVPPVSKSETVAHPRHQRHHAKPAETETAEQEPAKPAAAPDNSQPNPEVASGEPTGTSPIGELSTANNDANTADRQALANEITGTENALNGIHRSLSSDEQKTAALIRTFIGKARQALKIDDLDGAKNFSTKAKILLQELTKQ